MIVYRDQRVRADPHDLLGELRRRVERLPQVPDHDTVVALLVDIGMLEAGVADALAPAWDEDHDLGRSLRAASLAAGHVLVASWHRREERLTRWCGELRRRLDACADLRLPDTVDVQAPEGFAQYGLYPECHLEAAERVMRELQPATAVCLGLRSIGTALSAVVAACLEDGGSRVRSYTVRPHGHPFDRRVVLGESLRAALTEWSGALFLLVDEGPGISGSSLGGAAEALSALGIPDERIVFLPAWDPEAERLRSETARRRWRRHRRYVMEFDRVWLESGRFLELTRDQETIDVSAGQWREQLIADPLRRPAVHPHHERRKLRTRDRMLRFAGLGSVGQARLARARVLAEAGFSPHPSLLSHGFLALELVPGTPLVPGETDAELVDRIARYLACVRERFALPEGARTDLSEMIEVNLGEAGLDGWTGHLRDPADGPPVVVDGRMLPHEWLRTPRGYIKVDALDHGDDHFFPGPVDIAWDLAAAAIELEMSPAARQSLVERYRRLSGDRTITGRLPYYTVAYLAFRIGYAALASEVLAGTPDGSGFERMRRRYEAALSGEPASV